MEKLNLLNNIIAIVFLFLFPIEGRHIYKGQPLPNDYKPKQLTVLSRKASYLDTVKEVDSRIAPKLEQLIVDAEKDAMCLTVIGAYRSFEYQQELYDKFTDKAKVAKPGESEHQTGLAVDFEACPMTNGWRDDTAERLELLKDFNELPEYKWLKKNAGKYGIEESYREDNQKKTGYPAEPWHWKFMIKS